MVASGCIATSCAENVLNYCGKLRELQMNNKYNTYEILYYEVLLHSFRKKSIGEIVNMEETSNKYVC